jgi:hypothetical protein
MVRAGGTPALPVKATKLSADEDWRVRIIRAWRSSFAVAGSDHYR